MPKILYLTEKPSQVKALKPIASGPEVSFINLQGHIMEAIDFADYDKKNNSLKSWTAGVLDDTIPFFPPVLKKRVKPKDTKSEYKTDYPANFARVKEALSACDQVILACDPDNEGVVLAMEVIEACNAEDKVIGMVNMSKLDKTSLVKELKTIDKIPYKAMNIAGNARGDFDFLYGINLTRTATVMLGGGKVLHVGGVKSPLIRMVVDRENQIKNFGKIPYWNVFAKVKDPKTGKEFKAKVFIDGVHEIMLSDGEMSVAKNLEDAMNKKKASLEMFKDQMKNISFKTSKYSKTAKQTAPPKPFSTADASVEAKKYIKLTGDKLEELLNSIYHKKISSYPRTSENYFSEGMYNDVPQTIKQLQDFFPELSKIALKQPYLKRECFNDKKLEGKAHTAISPTLENPRGVSLSDNESKMFWIVAMRYFIQFMDDYKYSQISIDGISSLDMKKIEIKASEKVEISRGFKELYDSGKRDSQVQTFPELSKGDPLDIVSIILEQKDKKPKPRFDTVSLAKGMEKISTIYDNPELKKHLGDKGIGTSSTRSATIKAIIREGYAEEIKGKIHATQRGIDYIDTIPDEISEPVKRANLEEYLNQILLGKISKEQFMNASKKDIFKLVASIKNISKEKGIKVSNGGSDPKKAQDYALKIAKNIGVTLDDEILEDRAKLSGWLDKNVKKAKFGLSDKQKSMIIKHCEDDEIKKLVDTTDPKELKKVKKALDDIFASWNKKKKSSTPDRSM